MSRFTVVWARDAEDGLAEIWIGANNRSEVTQAVTRIDSELSFAANEKGKPLSEGLRRLEMRPLVAVYSLSEADRLVEIVGILYKPGPSALSPSNEAGPA